MMHHRSAAFLLLASLLPAAPALAAAYHFSSGGPDNRMAAVSQPSAAGVEAEAADDFLLDQPTTITHATFTGLFAGGTAPTPSDVTVEIYRVFPQDSTVPPSGNVPTRANSPSDVIFASRDSAASALTFSTSVLSPTFTALNSVQSGGIHPSPSQTTGGNGPLSGQEVSFDVTFTSPLVLPAGQYFFVPQVALTGGSTFYWLSAPRPITGAGTTPFAADRQSWIRDANLAPDWLRIGTDIVGSAGGATPPTFNGTFTLDGIVADPVPTLSTFGFLALALGLAAVAIQRLRS